MIWNFQNFYIVSLFETESGLLMHHGHFYRVLRLRIKVLFNGHFLIELRGPVSLEINGIGQYQACVPGQYVFLNKVSDFICRLLFYPGIDGGSCLFAVGCGFVVKAFGVCIVKFC